MNHNGFDISCFRYMGAEEREVIKRWLYQVKPKTDNQKAFLKRVQIALEQIKYDYFIADTEPSLNENNDIFYRMGSRMITDMNCLEWQSSANNFFRNQEWHSGLATLFEGDLLKAYKISIGYWSIANVSESRIFSESIDEIFSLNDGFAIVKNRYEGTGRYFMSTFDYFSVDIAKVPIRAFAVVVLKKN